ncbi:MAG TPA: hypothetical protein VM118_07210 [Acidobacteriota bacterium]|nr:hypothetical protein [Acidobacteriota bacterium]
MKHVSSRVGVPRLLILLFLSATLPFHCSKSDKEETPGGSVRVFEQPEAETGEPVWLQPSRNWPDTLHWALDSTWETTVDGFFMRMRMMGWKVFLGGPHADEHPLWCQAETTVRPVPRWEHVRGLTLDSVVFYDPVRSTPIRSLRMLSSRRTHLEGTVRTRFTSDAAVRFTVDLDEGQPLEPTVYFSWDGRTIVVTTPSIPVQFLMPRENHETPALPDWPEL